MNRETVPAPEPGPRRPVATPPELQADIDAGLTADKVDVFDPAAAPLGTDEEAAGQPTQAEQVALARGQERRSFLTEDDETAAQHAPDVVASREALEEGAERRFSPAVAFALVAAAALLAFVFAFLTGRA
jgi:hypothetical protein